MKALKFIATISFVFIFAFSALAQRRVTGKVIEVIDGKTVKVKLSNGSIMPVTLQYIEVPEYDQPLNQAVKDHLSKLILAQTVDVNPRGIKDSKTVGQVSLNGVDIAQQMIRDGAAWYAIPDKNGQNLNESAKYQSQEALAKAEKRGIWAEENLLPAWEHRAAREQAEIQAEKDALEKIKQNAIAARAQTESFEVAKNSRANPKHVDRTDQILWANPNVDLTEIPDANGLITSRIDIFDKDVVMTASSYYDLSNGKEKRRVESRTMYLGSIKGGSGKELVSIGFLTKSPNKSLQNSNNLTIEADGKTFKIGKAFRLEKNDGKIHEEMLIYYFDLDVLTTIATAARVKFNLGEFSTMIDSRSHEAHKKLTLQLAKKK